MHELPAATVEVVYATPDEQPLVRVPYEAGLTAAAAVERSGLRALHPEIERAPLVLGIFGVRVEPDRVLAPGDRVEICRPLKVDPRDMRRRLLASGKVMGGAEDTTPTKPRGPARS